MRKRKGFVNSGMQLMTIGILFIVGISFAANLLGLEGVKCSNPDDLLSEPSENATTVEKAIDPANSLVDIFFGCSSENQLLNAIFLSLKAGMVLVLLGIIKDLVPFT